MTSIDCIILDTPDPVAAQAFYDRAFGLGSRLRVRAGQVPASGFRGFTLSLVVSQPADVDALINGAIEAGATAIKPVRKTFWGYGGVVRAPDGAIWKVATPAKKNSGPATRDIDAFVLLIGVADVKATKQFYVDHGLSVAKSFGSKYVEFDATDSPVKLALYGFRALAKDAGVPPEAAAARAMAIASGKGPFTDPDGFEWEAVPV